MSNYTQIFKSASEGIAGADGARRTVDSAWDPHRLFKIKEGVHLLSLFGEPADPCSLDRELEEPCSSYAGSRGAMLINEELEEPR